MVMLKITFHIFMFFCESRVDVPMGGAKEVYTSLEQKQEFSYANVRKATYRGSMTIMIIQINRTNVIQYLSTVLSEEYSYFGSLMQCSFQC